MTRLRRVRGGAPLADLDRPTACGALRAAALKRGLSKAKAAAIETKCMKNWTQPPKKQPNPKFAACPLKPWPIVTRSGRLVTVFDAHVCRDYTPAQKAALAKRGITASAKAKAKPKPRPKPAKATRTKTTKRARRAKR
jgi:hypothetical protein